MIFILFSSCSLDGAWKNKLDNERPAELYSFVCNATLAICKSTNFEK